MVEIKYTGDALWERIARAVEKAKDRLRRVTRALNAANIPYAIIGGNAVQHWVSQVDESVVRNTRDVDIILNESDLESAIKALESEGFIHRRAAGVTIFRREPMVHFWWSLTGCSNLVCSTTTTVSIRPWSARTRCRLRRLRTPTRRTNSWLPSREVKLPRTSSRSTIGDWTAMCKSRNPHR